MSLRGAAKSARGHNLGLGCATNGVAINSFNVSVSPPCYTDEVVHPNVPYLSTYVCRAESLKMQIKQFRKKIYKVLGVHALIEDREQANTTAAGLGPSARSPRGRSDRSRSPRSERSRDRKKEKNNLKKLSARTQSSNSSPGYAIVRPFCARHRADSTHTVGAGGSGRVLRTHLRAIL